MSEPRDLLIWVVSEWCEALLRTGRQPGDLSREVSP